MRGTLHDPAGSHATMTDGVECATDGAADGAVNGLFSAAADRLVRPDSWRPSAGGSASGAGGFPPPDAMTRV